MSASETVLEGLRKIAKQQKGETKTIYSKEMVHVKAEFDACVYVLLEQNIDLSQMKLPPGDTAKAAFAFVTLLSLKRQKLVFFKGTPRWDVWVTVEEAPTK